MSDLIAQRMEQHTDRTGDCWIWTAYRNQGGYGRLNVDGRLQQAHRISYEIHVGPIPNGLHLDHLCRNRACVNPQHLEPVTNAENHHRGYRANKTHCPHGHAYDAANTFVSRRGGRECRTCRRAYIAIYRAMGPDERAARKAAGLPTVDLGAHFAEQELAA